MWCGVVTLFPEMFKALTDFGMTRKAIDQNLLRLSFANPRDFTTDVHRTVDDRPYGGGPGMVMKVAPLLAAISELRQQAAMNGNGQPLVIALSPQGRKVTQTEINALVQQHSQVILVAGRYEGIDERVYELAVDVEWSIGDYVLSGGELGAMVIIDAITRLIPGVLGDAESAQQDSFMQGLLDCPHYTRPETIAGLQVPAVLLSGDHAAIAKWRAEQSMARTQQRRPDLLDKERVK
jgi:tRNA (guanine37-N1)-methyltransferase